jgi:GWxTD domain-containing protein
MMRASLIFLFAFFFSIAHAGIPDRVPRVLVHYVQLQQQDGSLLHTIFAVNGASLVPNSVSEGKYQGGVRIELQFHQNDSLVFQDAFEMLSPVVNDSLLLNGTFLHQSRYALKDGSYDLTMRVNDLLQPLNVQEISTEVEISTEKQALIISEPLFYSASTAEGSDIEPLIPTGDYLFPESARFFRFFAEVYNLNQQTQNKALAKFYLTDMEGKVLGSYASFKRIDPDAKVELSGGFDLSNLARGLYFLNIELLNREGEVLSHSQTLFYRKSQIENELSSEEETFLAAQNWLPSIDEVDSLTYLLDVLHPIGDNLERLQIDNMLETATPIQKKRFIAGFWGKYYPLETQQAFNQYMEVVSQTNKKYSTRVMRGYRTDRGRVYLQYGSPDLVEDRKYEPSMYPYEIWQYNRLRSNSSTEQVNRVFIFANLGSAGDLYQLLHSNADGEYFNERWSLMLNRRVLPQMDIDENGADIIQNGGRSNSNLIINGGSLDRINRR